SEIFDAAMVVEARVKTVEDGDIISLDGVELKVLHIPGHSPGGMALYLQNPQDKILFSGDNLFFRGIGRTDFDGGDHELLVESIKKKILTLPPDTLVLPGHGARTTVGEEKDRNPFLQEQ
ncbi:MAG: MBL fold metallo-hydrolase, partial [Candidatus Omnitrophica bacterium]|nr:MBL fold metallo-hydrolase [Candidatus Omnitrophota bacterium]